MSLGIVRAMTFDAIRHIDGLLDKHSLLCGRFAMTIAALRSCAKVRLMAPKYECGQLIYAHPGQVLLIRGELCQLLDVFTFRLQSRVASHTFAFVRNGHQVAGFRGRMTCLAGQLQLACVLLM